MSKKAQANGTVVATFINWLKSADFIRLDDGCMLDSWYLDAAADNEDPVLTVNWESEGNDYEERFTRAAIESGHFENGKFCLVNDEGEKAWINAGKVVPLYPFLPESEMTLEEEYTVRWEIDLDAASPQEAAKEALETMQDTGSIATFFTVKDKAGAVYGVDLTEETVTTMAKQPLNRVGVVLEGGLVQSVVATRPEELDVVVIDYDTDGADESELTDVEQSSGHFSEAAVSFRGKAEEATINLNRLFDEAEE